MSISWRDSRARRVTLDALLIAFALMLSFLEALLPLDALIPLPGFRLGLANLVVTVVFVLLSPTDAAVVSAGRILIMGLLFGTVTSLYFSALGGLFAYLMLAFLSKVAKRNSFLGVSVLCAAAHNVGQLTAAATLFGTGLIFSYLPWLLLASALYGGIVGILLNLLTPRLQAFLQNRRLA